MSQRARMLLRDTQTGHTARRVVVLLLLVVVALVVISLVLLSPVALAALNPDGSADWERLANIAQTYAAASAVLALLALGAVAVSLVLQAREMRAARLQAMRMAHMDLMKLALDNPRYLRAIGQRPYADDAQRQEALFVNLLIAHWEMSYLMGGMNKIALRAAATSLFSGEAGPRYWSTMREQRLHRSRDKQTRRFHEILDEEYQKATQPPPAPEPEPAAPEPEPAAPESPAREESDQEPPEQSP